MDIDEAFQQAGEFLRRHIKSRAVRAAEKRRRERKARDAGRRFGRAAAVAGTSGAGIVGYTALVAPLATTSLAAAGIVTIMLAAGAVAWPAKLRRGDTFSQAELAALPGEAEEWLLDQRDKLPKAADRPLDTILTRLADLQPQLGTIDPNSTLAWDARRLLGDHLPRLIHAYLELPESMRDEDREFRKNLVEGMHTLADELGNLCREVSRERLLNFEAHGRFLQSKYRDGLGSG
jgi:hypothetical protein